MQVNNCCNVLFFGSIADKLGKRQCNVQIEAAGITLAALLALIGVADCAAFTPLLFAVNHKQEHDMNLIVYAGDEVAIMPPFSGG